MGIPLFWNALKGVLEIDRRSLALRRLSNVRTLSIDANTVFHIAANYAEKVGDFDDENRRPFIHAKTSDERKAEIIRLSIEFLKQIIRYYSPSEAVIIAVDGPIPMTKIQQQKQRRYRSGFSLESDLSYDGNMITPGTAFMHDLDDAIHEQIYNAKYEFNVKKIIYSSHRVEGEGEHKIFEYLHDPKRFQFEGDKESNHVIYGNDSDLILLGMISKIDRLYISKSVPLKVNQRDIMGEEFFHEIIDVEDLRRRVNDRILLTAMDLGKITSEQVEANSDEILDIADLDDFVFAMSFVGNDFLPTVAMMCNMKRSLKYIFDALATFGHLVTSEGNADWERIQLFVERLSKIETSTDPFNGLGEILKDSEVATPTETGFVPLQSQLLELKNPTGGIDYEKFRSGWYIKALGPIYEPNPFPFTISNRDISKMCLSYLQGLVWVYKYYKFGHQNVTWLWYYPYFYAPMLLDIYVTLRDSSDESMKDLSTVTPYHLEVRFKVLHQLVAVMPRQSMKHLPEILLPFYQDDSALSPMMPLQGIVIDKELIEREYQAKTILPMANYYRITQELFNLPLLEREIKRYEPRLALTNDVDDSIRAAQFIQAEGRATMGAYQAQRREQRLERESAASRETSREESRGRGRGRGRGRT
ncbi:XRN 5-3 exoribonuclease [uncultured virus]|nr:XRN 5-3 exoribonuclease [uncultured virus]